MDRFIYGLPHGLLFIFIGFSSQLSLAGTLVSLLTALLLLAKLVFYIFGVTILFLILLLIIKLYDENSNSRN